ncbi:MAG TPA: hypothetical protein VM531_11060 [Sphingomicrobium sp.]|jgi:hypothetical protein|nr:hypothetical protein [Sphingomicrobium sp.]
MAGIFDIGTLQGNIEISEEITKTAARVNRELDSIGSKFDGITKGLVIGSAAIVGAIGGIAAGIVLLGEKGSTILGVEEAFDKLAVSIGETGDALLGGLTEGVKSTVDSFELMQSANRALSAGVKLTAADMKTLGSVSREMGKAAGTDAATELDKLFRALTTGQPRLIRQSGLVVDLEKHQKLLAASLDTTVDKLNRHGQTLAAQNAIMEAARQKLELYGESQLSFKERVQQAQVAVGDWVDTLSKTIASSPAVMKAFDDVANAIAEAFGDKGQGLIDTLTKGIDKFAEGVSYAAQGIVPLKNAIMSVIDTVKGFWDWLVDLNDQFKITDTVVRVARASWTFLKDAFNLVRDAAAGVIAAWRQMPEWLQQISKTALLAGAGITGVTVAANAAAGPIGNVASKMADWVQGAGGLASLTKNIVPAVQNIDKLIFAISNTTVVIGAYVIATDSMTIATTFWTGAIVKAEGAVLTLATSTGLLAAAQRVATGVTAMATASKTALAGITSFLVKETMSLLAMVGLETAVQRTATGATTLYTTAKGLLGTVTTFVTGVMTRFTAAMGLTSAALNVTRIAAGATTVAMGLLGTALLALTSGPALVAITALAFSFGELSKAVSDTWARWKAGKEMGAVEFFTQQDEDNWVRRMFGIGQAARDMREKVVANLQAMAEETQRWTDNVTGAALARDVAELTKRWESLSDSQRRNAFVMGQVGKEALLLRNQGIPLLHYELNILADAEERRTKVFEKGKGGTDDLVKSFVTAAEVAAKMRQSLRELSVQAEGFSLFAGGDTEGLPVKMQQEWLGALQAIIDKGGQLTASQQQVFDVLDKTVGKTAELAGIDVGLSEVARQVTAIGGAFELSIPALEKVGKHLAEVRERGGEIPEALQPALDRFDAFSMRLKDTTQAAVDSLADFINRSRTFNDVLATAQARNLPDYLEKVQDAAVALDDLNQELQLTSDAIQFMGGVASIGALKLQELGKQLKDLKDKGVALSGPLQEALDVSELMEFEPSTILMRMREAGLVPQLELDRLAEKARITYKKILEMGTSTPAMIGKAWRDMREAEDRANEAAIEKWRRQVATILDVGDSIQQAGRAINGFTGLAVSGIGRVISAWGEALIAVRKYAENVGGTATGGQKLSALVGGVAGVIEGTGTGTDLERVLGGAMSGAAAGAAIGAAFAPATLGVSIAVGALGGALIGAFRDAGPSARELLEEFEKLQGGAQALKDKMKLLGEEGLVMWSRLRPSEAIMEFMESGNLQGAVVSLVGIQNAWIGGAEAMAGAIDTISEALKKLDDDVKRYGLTWADFEDPADRMRRGSEASGILMESFKRLTTAGFSASSIIRGMATDVNDWLATALEAGTKIPPEIGKIIKELITSKQLTEDNARALLGLADDGMPSLADITAAAERYGLKLDELGPKVQQLRINEAAEQIVKDFNLLIAAGVPFETLMKNITTKIEGVGGEFTEVTVGMQKSIQDLVTKALTMQLTLPASMKPIIERLIEAGGLTDEFGQKLETTSRLQFETPLVDRIDDLIEAIERLILKFQDISPAIDTEVKKGISFWDRLRAAMGAPIPTPGFAAPTPSAPPSGPQPPVVSNPGFGSPPVTPESTSGPGSTLPNPAPIPPPTGSGPSPNITIVAWDGASVQNYLENGGAEVIAQAVVPKIPRVVEYYGEGQL